MPTLNELTTAEEFRNAEPGTYVVTGEASAEMARQVARQLERKSFDNSTIRERTPGKPHIVFVAGYWRVSTWVVAPAGNAVSSPTNSLTLPSPWEPNPAGKELIELFHKMIRVRHEHEKKR